MTRTNGSPPRAGRTVVPDLIVVRILRITPARGKGGMRPEEASLI